MSSERERGAGSQEDNVLSRAGSRCWGARGGHRSGSPPHPRAGLDSTFLPLRWPWQSIDRARAFQEGGEGKGVWCSGLLEHLANAAEAEGGRWT